MYKEIHLYIVIFTFRYYHIFIMHTPIACSVDKLSVARRATSVLGCIRSIVFIQIGTALLAPVSLFPFDVSVCRLLRSRHLSSEFHFVIIGSVKRRRQEYESRFCRRRWYEAPRWREHSAQTFQLIKIFAINNMENVEVLYSVRTDCELL